MHVFQVGQSNRKDVRNAVEAALKAQPGWEKRSGFNRAQILYYIAENLEMRSAEFAKRLADLAGKSMEDASAEVGVDSMYHPVIYPRRVLQNFAFSRRFLNLWLDYSTGHRTRTNLEAPCRRRRYTAP